MKRKLGRSGIEVSALGLGCWQIGGVWNFLDNQAGWGVINETESIKAIHLAVDNGVTFFDTAANYGCGQSERILGKAFKGKRDKVVIATKFGYNVDEATKNVYTYGKSEEESDVTGHVRSDLEKSLKRLRTDYIDVYLLHIWGLSIERALNVREELENLVKEGLIRTYGWSTDRTDAVKAFSTSSNCGVVEQQLNVFDGNMQLLKLCEEIDLASINRAPLGMGILTGKFTPNSSFSNDDMRKHVQWFPGLKNGKPNKDWLDKLDDIKDILTGNGRTLAQGCLAWIWGQSRNTIPIPGFKSVKQAEENAKTMEFGPLSEHQMKEIESILKK